ncbi:MAG: hypothetical protein HY763_04185 [Planctomycetes bacterium]|nr:hypothetical protein [Planctomycetota bacterium]
MVVVSGTFAALFVGSDVIEQHFFPGRTGWRHALLTVQAVVVTVLGVGATYFVMRREQRRISDTASHLSRLLESYTGQFSAIRRFENPHLVSCHDVFECGETNCPAFTTSGERCWQTRALSRAARDQGDGCVTLQQCHECRVYRVSCPDKLTELGESFNNLMFLLEEETLQVGRMRSQLVEKEKMVAIGQMAAGIAHEIGNPLSSISSIVQMLKRGRSVHSQQEELDLIERHIQRISGTVRQLSTLSRPTAERWERTNLAQTLEETVHLFSIEGRARKVAIDFEMPKLPPTFALRHQLQQVFINLALNAFDAMPGGGTLTVRAARHASTIVVRFADTGCGIPPEVGRRVFEPFFTTKEPGAGTGLGLSVSYGIIQKHGGKIDFAPQPDGGTVFFVEIPLLDKPPDE